MGHVEVMRETLVNGILGTGKKDTEILIATLADMQPNLPEVEYERLFRMVYTTTYEQGGPMENWGQLQSNANLSEARFLLESGLIPKPSFGTRPVILSTSANGSITENILQNELGNEYLVVASDLGDIPRVEGPAHKCRADARNLPFGNETVDLIYDNLGAMWYEAFRDVSAPLQTSRVISLFKEYDRVLKPNGKLVIDDLTADIMNLLVAPNSPFLGFPPIDYESHRVYTKFSYSPEEYLTKYHDPINFPK